MVGCNVNHHFVKPDIKYPEKINVTPTIQIKQTAITTFKKILEKNIEYFFPIVGKIIRKMRPIIYLTKTTNDKNNTGNTVASPQNVL
jgi:hypothetical protein